MTVPVFTEQLFITSIGVLNTIIASGLGKEAISAIGMVDSFNNIIIYFFNSLAVGGTVAVAQYMGQGKASEAKKSATQAIVSSLLLSSLIMVFILFFRNFVLLAFIGQAEDTVINYSMEYIKITLLNYPLTAFSFVVSGILRSSGSQEKPMKINIIINVVNVVLSYLLIYGITLQNGHMSIVLPGMGVKGAAVAITAARLLGAVLFFLAITGKYGRVSMETVRQFRLDFKMQKTILNIGLPSGIESFVFNAGKFVQQIFIISLGTASIAANTISWSIFGLLIIPGNTFAIVATTMVGYYIGMRDFEEVKKVNMYIIKLASISKLAISLIVFPLASLIAAIYSKDAEVIRLTAEIIRMNAVAIPVLWPFSFIIPSSLRGAGDTKFPMVVSIVSLWTFRVLVGYIFSIVLGFGIVGLWAAMYIDWVLRGIVYYLRLRGGKWRNAAIE